MALEDASSTFDVIIVGGGPAGLSAALMLGRCRRRIAVCDEGRQRNLVSSSSHGFFTRDGEAPRELLRLGREELRAYDVSFFDLRVTDVGRGSEGFWATLADGRVLAARKLLLATGLIDELPAIDGVRELYGKSVFHCPYCDGWEFRDRPLAAYSQKSDAAEFAVGVRTWSEDVVLCTDGSKIEAAERRRLEGYGIVVRTDPIRRLEGRDDRLERIVFENGESLARTALFFDTACAQRSDLPGRLGCEMDGKGCIKVGMFESTQIPGLYAAGDASEDVNFISMAVAEGTRAGFAINKALRRENVWPERR